jgi:hypothetical protein
MLGIKGKESVLSAINRILLASKTISKKEVPRISDRVHAAMIWLDMFTPGNKVSLDAGVPPSILDAFCGILKSRCEYGANERDMVLMHHEFGVKTLNGTVRLTT